MRKLIACLVVLVMVLGFATVSTAEAAPYKVGFALQTLEVAVWQRMVNGMEAAAEDLPEEKIEIPKAEELTTTLGDLFKNIKL